MTRPRPWGCGMNQLKFSIATLTGARSDDDEFAQKCPKIQLKSLAQFANKFGVKVPEQDSGAPPKQLVNFVNSSPLCQRCKAAYGGNNSFDGLMESVKDNMNAGNIPVLLVFTPTDPFGWHFLAAVGAKIIDGKIVSILFRDTDGELMIKTRKELEKSTDQKANPAGKFAAFTNFLVPHAFSCFFVSGPDGTPIGREDPVLKDACLIM